jgi:hypothetical protein
VERLFLLSNLNYDGLPYRHQLYSDREAVIDLVTSAVEKRKGFPLIMNSDMEEPIRLTKGREQISSMVDEICIEHNHGNCSVIVFSRNGSNLNFAITPVEIH